MLRKNSAAAALLCAALLIGFAACTSPGAGSSASSAAPAASSETPGEDTAEPTVTPAVYDTSAYDEKLAAGLASADPVEAYAWGLVRDDAASMESSAAQSGRELCFTDAELVSLEIAESYDGLVEGCTVEVWALDYRLTPSVFENVVLAGGMNADEEGRVMNSGSMGSKYPVVKNTGGVREVLGYLWTGEGFGLIYNLCDFLDERGIPYDCVVDTGKFTSWQKLYWDFYAGKLEPLSDYITGIGLFDLSGDNVPELVVYTPGASASCGCDIYTAEDGEVRAFSTICGLLQYSSGSTDSTELAPLSQNAGDYIFWANPADGLLPEDMGFHFFRLYFTDEDTNSPKAVYILNSGNAAWPADSWCDYYLFGEDGDGCLTAELLFSWHVQGTEDNGDYEETAWQILGGAVAKEDYDAAMAEFEAMMAETYRYTPSSYENYCVYDTDDLTRSVKELLEMQGRFAGLDGATRY